MHDARRFLQLRCLAMLPPIPLDGRDAHLI
jgi:hypothetical protein